MIDVSDGLGRDLGHIARMSGVSVELDLTEIPVPEGIDPLAALGHGEDYELAFTARGEVPQSAGGVRITRIGTVLHDPAAPGRVLVRRAMGDLDLSAQGFEHGAPDHR
jgi:thiamine-monophosphate kinase